MLTAGACGDFKRACVLGVAQTQRHVQIKYETVRAIDTYTQCNPGAYNSMPARGLRSRASVLLFLGWTNEEIQRREQVTE